MPLADHLLIEVAVLSRIDQRAAPHMVVAREAGNDMLLHRHDLLPDHVVVLGVLVWGLRGAVSTGLNLLLGALRECGRLPTLALDVWRGAHRGVDLNRDMVLGHHVVDVWLRVRGCG